MRRGQSDIGDAETSASVKSTPRSQRNGGFRPDSGPCRGDPFRPARLLRTIRANWPSTEIVLRADSHYCSPEVLDWCRTNGVTEYGIFLVWFS